MRLSVLLAAICFAGSAVAEENFPVVLLESKDAKGGAVQFQTDLKTLYHAPRWTLYADRKGDPPLSIGAAAEIAQKAVLVRTPKADGVSFTSVRFLKRDISYSGGGFIAWFYVFSFEPIFPTGPASIEAGPNMEIVVLLDGTAIYPSPTK